MESAIIPFRFGRAAAAEGVGMVIFLYQPEILYQCNKSSYMISYGCYRLFVDSKTH